LAHGPEQKIAALHAERERQQLEEMHRAAAAAAAAAAKAEEEAGNLRRE